ncbi:alkyl sulfatase dimerization domain-containing protein [Bradyrhizobium sp. AZCC 1610]|uniref:alkyl sulfatase dimerization domain-containing protein n=1 Tax=Bradyrhizobium sp. AZCC 1610 TaxID=3117020 RepID=UPI002FEFF5A0
METSATTCARSKRYVAALRRCGEAAVVALGRKAFADGDYRWVVELVNKAVFANPNNAEARALQANALEQIGYQTESATWRNAYLMGALELRSGPKDPGVSTSGADTVRGMTNELLFDFVALRLNHEKTDGMKAAIETNSRTSLSEATCDDGNPRVARWSIS